MATRVVVLALLALAAGARASGGRRLSEVRSLDGSGNNAADEALGAAGGLMISIVDRDITGIRAGPNARNVTADVCRRRSPLGATGLNQLHTAVGQLAMQDLVKTAKNTSEPLTVAVPRCDADFDADCSGTATMSTSRLQANAARLPFNGVSSFLDASIIYGSTQADQDALRTFSGGLFNLTADGSPQTQAANPNKFALPDARANLTPLNAAIVTVFLREHNRRAAELVATDPGLSDEDAFQAARRWVVALWQHVVVDEYLPLTLGAALPAYAGYDADVDPTTDVFFAAVVARYGHTTISSVVRRANADYSPDLNGDVFLRDVIGAPVPWAVESGGLDPFLRGAMVEWERAADGRVADDMMLYAPGTGDVGVANLMRGRELGLPTYGAACAALGVTPAASFEELSPDSAAELAAHYATVADVDPWVAGVAEQPADAALLGPLFTASLQDQFTRARDGDRLWWEAAESPLSSDEVAAVAADSLADVLLRNVEAACVPSTAMMAQQACPAATTRSFQPVTGYTFQWTLREDEGLLDVEVRAEGGMMIGVGWASGMEDADIVLVQAAGGSDGAGDVTDMWSTSFMPVSDADKGGVDNLSGRYFSSEDGVVTAGFTRALANDADPDWDAAVAAGRNDMIFSINFEDAYAYHGRAQRVAVSLDLATGDYAVSSSDKFFWFHGFSMCFFWGFCIPLGAYVARYRKDSVMWLNIHLVTGRIGASGALSLGVSAILVRDDVSATEPHHIIGFVLVAAVVVEVWLGNAMRSGLKRHSHKVWHKSSRRIHRAMGWALTAVGLANIPLGMELLLPSASVATVTGLTYAYFAALGALLLFKEAQLWVSLREAGGGDEVTDVALFNDRPEYRWDEVAEHARHGFAWVVVDNLIVDLSDWLVVHPGGPTIIQAAAGTDVTSEFNGAEKMGAHQHRHSHRARKVMLSRVVGRIRATSEEEALQHHSQCIFRFAVVAVETMGRTLVLHLSSRQQGFERVLAFDGRFVTHVELMASAAYGQIVQRKYTPMHGLVWNRDREPATPSLRTLKLCIGLYPNGEMSELLRDMGPGDHVRVRGPLPTTSVRRPEPHGCWPALCLIAGGTGITPLLQIASAHLEHEPDCGCRGGVVHVVMCTRTEDDFIAHEDLERAKAFVKSGRSAHSIRVHYVVSQPTPDGGWTGHTGHITNDILRATLPQPPQGFTQGKMPRRNSSRRRDRPASAAPRADKLAAIDSDESGDEGGAAAASAADRRSRSMSTNQKKSRSRGSRAGRGRGRGRGDDRRESAVEMAVNPMFRRAASASGDSTPITKLINAVEAHDDLHVFVCGPPAFNERVVEKLLFLGYMSEVISVL